VSILDISRSDILSKFSFALSQVAALSLQIGFPNQASIPHSIANAFQTCVAVAVELEGFSFKEADPFKAFLADPSAFAVAAPADAGGAPAAAAPAAAAKPKEEEVDALDGGMDMFGGAKDY